MAIYKTNRRVLRAAGSDVLSFLERVITCKVEDLQQGTARFGALLTPQGKIISDMVLFAMLDHVLIDVPEATEDDVLKRLSMLKLRADVALEKTEFHVIASDEQLSFNSEIETEDPRTPDLRRAIIAPETELGETLSWLEKRIELMLPECGLDYDTVSLFPADVNMDLLHGVDYQKGCFVGQEVVSRMKRKTEVRKRSAQLTADTNAKQGDDVKAGEASIGQILAWSGGTGLALLRFDRMTKALQDGAHLSVNGAEAHAS